MDTNNHTILKQLGESNLYLSPIGFGAWAIGGGDWQYAWGPQDDSESVAAIHRALDLGINWVDTAAVYGLGHSEEIVGKALKQTTKKPYIFTKCGMLWDETRKINQSLKSIRKEVEDSLRRLQVEVIDLYQIHWPVPDAEIEEGWEAMAEIQREGKVKHIGASNFNVAQLRRAQKDRAASIAVHTTRAVMETSGVERVLFCCFDEPTAKIYEALLSGGLD